MVRAEAEAICEQILWAAAQGRAAVPAHRATLGAVFDRLTPVDREAIGSTLDGWLRRNIGAAMERGWWPADIVVHARTALDARHADVAAHAVVAHADSLDTSRAPASWQESYRDVLQGRSPGRPPSADPHRWHERLTLAGLLQLVPRLPTVEPPPSRWAEHAGAARAGAAALGADVIADAARRAGLDTRLLERVRALLAKAEGTEFEEEAAAFTAKAQELMTRHGIEAALLQGRDPDAAPTQRRLWIANPYSDVKGLLLNEIAAVNRCRAVSLKGLGVRTVIGFEADLIAVDILFTSLLVQGSTFLHAAGSRTGPDGRSRTASFRRSFWMSFATRIGVRLREAADATVAEADAQSGGRLLPVLATREELVATRLAEAVPNLVQRTLRASNADGWRAGHHAADRADLTAAKARLTRG